MASIEELLAEQERQAAEVKAERERQLQAALGARKDYIDTTPTAAFFDSMYGGQSVKGAQAVNQAAAQQEDLLQGLLKEQRTALDNSGLNAAKLSAADSLNRDRLDLARQSLEIKKEQLANAPAKLTKGQEAVDRAYAKTYEGFVASGGSSSVARQLSSLDDAKALLSQGKGLTGPSVGAVPKDARKFVNPESVAVQEQVEQVVQASMKETLGAQFTEREGQLVINRAYNPALPESENIKRIAAVQKEIQGIADAKAATAKYFEENGTLVGYRGPSVEQLTNKLISGGSQPSAAPKKNPFR